MRLHSPVPTGSRTLEEELHIGGAIRPGCMVQLNIWALHHMEKYWGPDHWEFKPERFSPENIDEIASYQFFPFSAGNRNMSYTVLNIFWQMLREAYYMFIYFFFSFPKYVSEKVSSQQKKTGPV
ncbi:hypothetical protein DPMN_100101 [Dreissena polymorpha]|uniref:Cytochrome P450 n=1 Tax=Dreissena polymorpha TaxID=45954 RepID=A0A9D4LGQ0_DREPO|nr:hypothetical protein DPMN_100101 [Dreissena polymorpha]